MIAPRIRSIKPAFFQHYNLWHLEQLTGMPMRIAYEAIWTMCDREGRFEWKPRALKLNGLPFDDVDPERVLEAFRVCGYVGRYLSADGARAYGFCLRFPNHQHINPRETATDYPDPPTALRNATINLHAISDMDLVGVLEKHGLLENGAFRSEVPTPTLLEENQGASDASTTREENALTREPRVFSSPLFSSQDLALDASRCLDAKDSLGDMAAAHATEHTNGQLDHAESPESRFTPAPPSAVDFGATVSPTPYSAALPAIRGPRTHDAIMKRLAAVSAEVASGSRKMLALEQMRRLAAELVFSYWTVRFEHPKARLDEKREARIIKRLEENEGDVSELLYALDGAYHNDHIMARGKYAGEPKYDGIETVLRDRAQVEKFASERKGYRDDKPHPGYVKYLAALKGEASEETQTVPTGEEAGV